MAEMGPKKGYSSDSPGLNAGLDQPARCRSASWFSLTKP